MSDDNIDVNPGMIAQEPPEPTPLLSGPVQAAAGRVMDELLRLFGLATNADLVPANAQVALDDADRRARAADAAAKFPANEAKSAAEMQSVGADGMAQQLPQMMSGMMGAATGAAGGVMGPLTQMPQQLFQAAQGAMQSFQGLAGGMGAGAEGLEGAALAGDFEPIEAGLEGAGGVGAGGGGVGGGGGGGIGTGPAGVMGPPPVPSSGAPTTPAAAPSKPAAVAPEGPTRPMAGGMGGGMMPMGAGAMGAAAGAGGEGGKDKPVEKKVAAPGVAHGQPVKGRVTPPVAMPVAKNKEGKPVKPDTVKRYVLKPDADDEKSS